MRGQQKGKAEGYLLIVILTVYDYENLNNLEKSRPEMSAFKKFILG